MPAVGAAAVEEFDQALELLIGALLRGSQLANVFADFAELNFSGFLGADQRLRAQEYQLSDADEAPIEFVHALFGAFPAFLVALPESFCLGLLVEDESHGLLDVHMPFYRSAGGQRRTDEVESQNRTICRETGQSEVSEKGSVAGSRCFAAKFQKRPFGLKQIRGGEIAGSDRMRRVDGDQCATTNV